MRWIAYNPRVMKRDEPVSDHQTAEDSCTDQIGLRSLGVDHQARAIGRLISQLDEAGDRIGASEESRGSRVASAELQHEAIVKKQDERRERSLDEIRAQAEQARADAEAKHRQRIGAISKERDRSVGVIQQQHRGVVSKAKKAAQEKIWLADTVLESETRKIDQQYKADQKSIEDRQKIIDSYEQSFGAALSPGVAKQLVAHEVRDIPEPCTLEGVDASIAELSGAVDEFTNPGLTGMLRGKKKKVELATDASRKLQDAKLILQAYEQAKKNEHEQRVAELKERYKADVGAAEAKAHALSSDSEEKANASLKEVKASHSASIAERNKRLESELQEIERWVQDQTAAVERSYNDAIQSSVDKRDSLVSEAEGEHERVRSEVEQELSLVAKDVRSVLRANNDWAERSNPEWDAMPTLGQPEHVPYAIRFSSLRVDLGARVARLPDPIKDSLGVAPLIETPGVLALPGPSSFLIRHDRESRDEALGTMRNVIARVLASFPGRKARFVLTDPIGIGQSFAGFMRLSDLDPSPVGQRIWADPNQIERQLVDLTEHMQTVIQKYLRKDYATIEEYNEAAGEIAEPYRFLVIPDLHVALTENGASKLKSILESGPRCGVYAIICAEHGAKLPDELKGSLDEVDATLRLGSNHSPFDQGPEGEIQLTLDPEPSDGLLSQILDRVAKASTDAGRIEVPFDRLTPERDDELWSRDCAEELVVPLGRSGARKVQELRLGLGTRQHALIAGRTGSGKSTLLHVMITAAGMWYGPDQLEMYLIDFKKGVEFKAYTGGRLPHVRAVAIESDREFGLSVLQRLDDELTKRGELFRKLGAQDLGGARKLAPEEHLPRVLLLIDEFQEFFTVDDEVASDASLLLDRLVRQGRAFGVHVILGSQTLSGAYSLARSTLGQIGVRVALQCSEADSYLILGEDNNAARLLERPGEAIYNNAGGLIEGNSPFQTAWLPDSDRDAALSRLPEPSIDLEPAVVFEGNTLAQFEKTRAAMLHAETESTGPRVLLGESVAIAPPVAPMLTKRSGANMLVVGPQATSAYGMLASGAITFAATGGARVIVLDATPEEDPDYRRIERAIEGRGENIEVHRAADASRIVSEINGIVQSRGGHAGDPVLLVIAGLHRLRELRKNEDFGFSLDDDGGASPDRELANTLLEGPASGVWAMVWCDTLTNLERTFERGTIREFGMRVLMQMSASDSTMLMDSSAASNLGANRALFTDDVEGTEIKFRPVQAPGDA